MGKHPLRILGALLLAVVASKAYADAASMLPHFYAEPGISKDRKLVASEGVDDHIDPFSGSLGLSHVDLYLPGNGGLDIKLERHYTSNIWLSRDNPYSFAPYPNMLLQPTAAGVGWSMHLGRVVVSERSANHPCEKYSNVIDDTTQNNALLELPDGSMQVLYVSVSGVADFITKNNWVANCYGVSEGLTVYAPNGLKYTMNHRIYAPEPGNYADFPVFAWFPTRIEDAKGNFLTITYTGARTGSYAHIDKITASDGREVAFTYTNGVLAGISVVPTGETWTYEYTEAGTINGHKLLSKVIRPDGSEWRYTYNPASATVGPWAMATVTSPYNGQVSYTYEHVDFQGPVAQLAGRDRYYSVAVKTRTVTDPNGADGTWTYTYQPGTDTTLEPKYKNDVTVVEHQNVREVYRHYGIQRQIGYLGASAFELWKTGMLGAKEIYDTTCSGSGTCNSEAEKLLRTETYTWQAPGVISDEINIVAPFDLADYGGVYYPQLVSKTVTQDGSTYTTQYEYDNPTGDPRPARKVETGEATRTTELTWYPASPQGVWLWDQIVTESLGSDPGLKKLRMFNYTDGTLNWQSLHGQYEEYTYTTEGDVNSKTDGRGHTWQYSSYYRGLPRSEIHPVDNTTSISLSRTINTDGTVATETNGRGFQTGYSYDKLNRVTGITPPINAAVTVEWGTGLIWGPNSRLKRKVSRGDSVEYTVFDGFGHALCVDVTNASDSVHVTKTFQYDAQGNKVFESYPFEGSCAPSTIPPPAPNGDTFAYDALGRLTKITHADNSFRSFSYLSGNRVQTINERGFVTTHTYRSYGEPGDKALMRVDAPENVTTVFTRNVLGQMLSVTQGERDAQGDITNGVTRTYTYDPNTNYLIGELNPETGDTVYGRDGVGNMISRRVGTSGETGYIYDWSNRLRAIDHPAPTLDVLYEHDNNGNLKVHKTTGAYVTGINFRTTRSHEYDENDNLKSESLNIGSVYVLGGVPTVLEDRTLNLGYVYDTIDQLDSTTYPSGRVVSFAPDALGRPTRVAPFVSSVSYHPGGQPASTRYANGIQTSVELNSRQWIQNIGASGVVDLGYTYDAGGNVETISDGVNPSHGQVLGYDGIDRLTTANGVWGTGSIGYDAAGNIRRKVLGNMSLSYGYDGTNRLMGISGTRSYGFNYDEYGNVISNGTSLFTYDDAGNLTFVSGGGSVANLYEPGNRRVREERGGLTTYYLYAKNGDLVGEYIKDSPHYKEYAYLGGRLVAMAANLPNQPPIANAGTDQSVDAGATVSLNGSASADPDGGPLSYQWAQTAGPSVSLSGAGSASASFVAPQLSGDVVLTFSLTVTDSAASSVATVSVTVRGEAPPATVAGLAGTPRDGQVAIAWLPYQVLPGGRAVSYNLYWSNTPGVTTETGNRVQNVTTPFVHTSLSNGQPYYYIVTGVNSAGESAGSSEILVVPGANQWGDIASLASGTPGVRVSRQAANASGQGVVIWTEWQPSGGLVLMARRLDADGVWHEPIQLVDNVMVNGEWSDVLHLAVDAQGGAVAVWTAGGDVYASNMSPTGLWSTPALLSTTKNQGQDVSGDRKSRYVAAGPNGDAVVVWMENGPPGSGIGNNGFLKTRRYDAASGTWTEPEELAVVSNGWVRAAQVTVDDAGNAMATWEWLAFNAMGPTGSLRIRRYDVSTGVWEYPQDLTLNNQYVSSTLAGDRFGNTFVAWLEETLIPGFDDPQPVLRVRRYDVVTGWGESETIAGPWGTVTMNPVDFSFAVEESGNAIIVWGDEHEVDWVFERTIYARRYVVGSGWDATAAVGDRHAYMNDRQSTPKVSIDSQGNAVVLWQALRDWNENGWSQEGIIWANHYAVGTGWHGAYDIRRCTEPVTCSYMDSAMDVMSTGNGRAMAMWIETDSYSSSNLVSRPYTWLGAAFPSQNHPPLVRSGRIPSATEGQLVTLSGGTATDQDGTIASYRWVQVGGPLVTLLEPGSPSPTFVAPDVTDSQYVEFIGTVIDNDGAQNSDYWWVEVVDAGSGPVNTPPTADAGVGQIVNAGIVVTLAGSGTDPDGTIASYAWIQTAGPSAILSGADTAVASFTAPMVTADTVLGFQLTVTDDQGATGSASVNITVKAPNQPPTASAGTAQTVNEGTAVVLTGSGSDPDGMITGYAWTQTDGPAVMLSNANTATASFTAPAVMADTALSFQLTVTDDQGATAGSTVSVTVINVNQPPVVTAGVDQNVASGATVTLNGTASDADNNIATYAWIQTAGPTVTLVGADTATASFSAPMVTTATVLSFQLTVTDTQGASASATTNVTVNNSNQAPTANAGTAQTVNEGATVTLVGSGSDPDGTVASYLWSQTSGPEVPNFSDNYAGTATFVAPQVNVDTVFTFELMVTDNLGATGTSTVSVTVKNLNQPPVANAGLAQTPYEGATVTLTGSGSDPDGTIASYSWSQTAGPSVSLSGANTATATFTAPQVTSDTVLIFQLTVTDNQGASSSAEVDVTVMDLVGADLAVTAATGSVSTIKRGSRFTFSSETRNYGNNATTIATTTGLYLSADGVITTADTLVGTVSVNKGLAAGATKSASSSVTVPSTLGPGTYYLGAIADYTSRQYETNEGNNSFTGTTIQVTQ